MRTVTSLGALMVAVAAVGCTPAQQEQIGFGISQFVTLWLWILAHSYPGSL